MPAVTGNKRKRADAKSEVHDWSSAKVAELKAELQRRGLDTSGKKADLVQRLMNDDGDNAK